jgi:hypothetical protein
MCEILTQAQNDIKNVLKECFPNHCDSCLSQIAIKIDNQLIESGYCKGEVNY